MTAEEIQRIAKVAEQGRDLLSKITVLKERISWLENSDQLYLAFDRGASKPGTVSTQRVPIDLSDALHSKIRDEVLAQHRAELATVEVALAELSLVERAK